MSKRIDCGMAVFLDKHAHMAFDIQPARAAGAIYIMADGSVNLPTAPIQTDEIMVFRKCG